MEDDEVCSVCFNRSMVMANGSLVCTVCGTQSQAFTEEVHDAFESALHGSRHKKTVYFKKERASRRPADQATPASLITLGYCKALQTALIKLCSHLQNSDVPQLPLEPVARRIWFQVVTQAQVLEPAFALVRQEQPPSQAENAELEELTSENMTLIRRLLHRVLHPQTVLLVLFLAIMVTRAALTPMDVIGKALNGSLPFYQELHDVSQTHDSDGSLKLDNLFTRIGVSGLWSFIDEATSLAAGIRLALPPVNSEAVLESFCVQLFLPKELGAGVIPILETCEAGGLQLHLWQDPYHMPYAKLMAMLVLVAKVQMQQDKLIAPGGQGWMAWAHKVVKHASQLHPPGHQAGAASYEQPDLARKTLLSTVFAGTEVAGEFKELQQILSSISASHHADDRQPPEDTALQEEDSLLKGQSQDLALLLTAASAIIWLKPVYLENIVSNLESELLKIERLAQHYSSQ